MYESRFALYRSINLTTAIGIGILCWCGVSGTERAETDVSASLSATEPSAESSASTARVLWSHQPLVRLRPSIPEELPHVPHFADLVEVELRRDQLRLVARGVHEELPARIAEIARSIKLADVPRRLEAHAVDRAHEVGIRHRVRGLLELPEILREPRDRR